MKNTALNPVTLLLIDTIHKHDLSLLDRYPDDIFVSDNDLLNRFGADDFHLAWCVGHSHSHLYPVGMHPHLSELITNCLGLSSKDLFFEIVRKKNVVTIQRLLPSDFALLSKAVIPFEFKGQNLDGAIFWMSKPLVRFVAEVERTGAKVSATFNFHAQAQLTSWQKYACLYFARRSASRALGTLFFDVAGTNWHTADS